MREAVGFLTVLGGAVTPSPKAWRWFPLVGAAIGGAVGASWWAANEVFSPLVAAVLAVAVDLAITGMLHVDGLADSADGLLGHNTRAERLRIMRTPDIGAFAVGIVAVVLLLRAAALAEQPVSIVLVVALWCTSRTVVAVVPARVPYARDEGIASAMLPGAALWPLLMLAPVIAASALVDGTRGAASVVIGATATLAVVLFGVRRLGGFTGDVLGAAIVVGETVGLVTAAARW
jgi:adenosylcobinamide-GDP ribazoletransferase